MAKQSYQFKLEGKPGNPCQLKSITLQTTSILSGGFLTDLLSMFLWRMDFMTKLY
jgi:hypothetical protein